MLNCLIAQQYEKMVILSFAKKIILIKKQNTRQGRVLK